MRIFYILPLCLSLVSALRGEVKPSFVRPYFIVDIDPSLLHLLPQGGGGTDTRVLPAPGVHAPFAPDVTSAPETPDTRVLPSGGGSQSSDQIAAAFLIGQLQGFVSTSTPESIIEDSRERKKNKGKGKGKKKKKNKNKNREQGQGQGGQRRGQGQGQGEGQRRGQGQGKKRKGNRE